MKLTPHEEKILEIIKSNPRIIDSPDQRSIVAKEYGLTEKTLRNRIAELKKRGLLNADTGKVEESTIPLITENDEINIKAILNIIIKQKRFVIKFSTFFMLIGLTYFLTQKFQCTQQEKIVNLEVCLVITKVWLNLLVLEI
jgi:DNA-binding Lrp family transcriptional regulator